MFQSFLNDLNNLKEIFDKEDISSYSLLLIKLYQILKEINSLNDKERKELGNLLKTLMDKYELNRMLTIQNLNKVFNSIDDCINIYDKENYITIFNIVLEYLRSEDQTLSFKVEQIICNFIQEIEKSIDENSSQNEKDYNNTEFNNSLENFYLENDLNFNENNKTNSLLIRNKKYLSEYIRQKNLLPYKCAICGLTSWQNNPLLLKLDSLNNEFTESNIKNLRFLCPNCYSQFGNE